MKAEIVYTGGLGRRGKLMLDGMQTSAKKQGIQAIPTESYRGGTPWLVIWGAGGPEQRDIIKAHVAGGGRAICFDMGYFYRQHHGLENSHCRLSIDGLHCPQLIYKVKRDSLRWSQFGIQLRADCNPKGHIVIAGTGAKSRDAYGLDGTEWEQRALHEIRKRYKKERVYYRPKPKTDDALPGASTWAGDGIEAVLSGAKFVVTRHSNVAVDCVVAGVPCYCEDGAGAAIWPSSLDVPPSVPANDDRRRFLRQVAWFDWSPTEAERGEVWRWVKELLA